MGLNGLVLQLMELDILSLGSLIVDFFLPFPFFAIAAIATSITMRDRAIFRFHLEGILPLIETTFLAFSIVPDVFLRLRLLFRLFVHLLVAVRLFLLTFIAPLAEPLAFRTFVDIANMLGKVTG